MKHNENIIPRTKIGNVSASVKKLHFVLSEYIINRPEMIAAVIYGKQRLGKSMYALKVGYDIYEDWDKVLENTIFTMKDVVKTIGNAVKSDSVIPYLIWDDSGVYGSKYTFFTNKKTTLLLQGLFDVVGTAVKGFVMTTPNSGNLLKSIREYQFYRIKIIKANSRQDRIAKGYSTDQWPSGTLRMHNDFEDHYNNIIPDDVYQRYIKTRKDYLRDSLKNLDDVLRDMEEDPSSVGLVDNEIDNMYEEVLETRAYIKERVDE